MKRSKINTIIKECEDWVASMGFQLPPWAHWSLEQWQTNLDNGINADEIFNNMLGWDVTDFNKENYDYFGLTLFTIRNGSLQFDKKSYAEKIMIVSEGQLNPMHFHWYKMEDIINRGGGKFIIEIYGSGPDGELSQDTISVKIDGIRRTYKAGSCIVLEPGESICIEQGLYHRFFAEGGTVLAGEVSMVNDDKTDNCFLEPLARYADIEEDEPPYRLLCGDYRKFLRYTN
ncbi:D-lyxose/D-mannose family sugar isomerase [Gracilinema caldarium]|uniref:D-lyxose/D-mannose family sugar isomerase n=1 Tax=Gracilinema caldarium TaxID=215591 RepID=UPI0026EB7733|nr:D-lyxose/D-mannose family sugar isomerase [Gracilinema caldarium]